MKELIKFEYRKLWNKITITAIIAMFILTTLHTVIYLNLQWRTIDKNEELVYGLKSFRALKEASEELEGKVDGIYIENLIKNYNSSYDKQYLSEHRGYLGTGGMTKYMGPNYLINYAYYGPHMSSGNDKMNLDYEFLESEERFYKKYKEAVKEHILTVNEWNGLFPASEKQISILESKIENVKTPFNIKYDQGLANLRSWYMREFPYFFIVIAFALACLYSKDSVSGVNELTLSSFYGRKKNMKARWIAGNLLAVTTYAIFVVTLVIEHGIVGSLHGWNASAQTFWYECLYNINIGTGLSIMMLGGLLGVLVMANIVMLLSIKTKNMKATAVLSIAIVWIFVRLSSTYSQIKLLLNPIQFKSDFLLTNYLFIGNTLVPYLVATFILGILYIGSLSFLINKSYKKYRLN